MIKIDLYTKIILTIIAFALSVLAISPFISPGPGFAQLPSYITVSGRVEVTGTKSRFLDVVVHPR